MAQATNAFLSLLGMYRISYLHSFYFSLSGFLLFREVPRTPSILDLKGSFLSGPPLRFVFAATPLLFCSFHFPLSHSRSAGHPADIKVTAWSEVTCADCAEQSYNGATPVVGCSGEEAGTGAGTPSPSSAGAGVGVGDDDAAVGVDGGDDGGNGEVAAPTAPPTTATIAVDGELGCCEWCGVWVWGEVMRAG